MKIKVVSDGTIKNTRIFNADTGEDISACVVAIRWEIDASKPELREARAVLTVRAEAEVEAEAAVLRL